MYGIEQVGWNGKTLYARGDTGLLRQPSIVFAGTRDPSEHGAKAGYRMVRKAARLSGRVIISGLALGCDTIAHRAALDEGAPTIAVLPCAADTVRPASNRGLAEEILRSGGCLISEYPPGTPTARWMFVRRDALMADLGSALIVIENGTGNGTMHTVREALKRGRPVGCYQRGAGIPGAFAGLDITGIPGTAELSSFLEAI